MKVIIEGTLFTIDDAGRILSEVTITAEGGGVMDKPEDVAAAYLQAVDKLSEEVSK